MANSKAMAGYAENATNLDVSTYNEGTSANPETSGWPAQPSFVAKDGNRPTSNKVSESVFGGPKSKG